MKSNRMELKCECGNDRFHLGSSTNIAMCSKCYLVYDENGNKVDIDSPIKNIETVYINK